MVVLDQYQIVPADDFRQRILPVFAEGDGGGVGAVRHQEHAGDLFLPAERIQFLRQHSAPIARDRNKGDVRHACRTDQVGVGELIRSDPVPQFEQGEQGGTDHVLRTGKDCCMSCIRLDAKLFHPPDARRPLVQMSRRFRVTEKLIQIPLAQHIFRRADHGPADRIKTVHDPQFNGVFPFFRSAGKRCHKGAAPRNAIDQTPFPAEIVRPGDRGEVDPQIVRQFPLGRQTGPRCQLSGENIRFQMVGEREINGAGQSRLFR